MDRLESETSARQSVDAPTEKRLRELEEQVARLTRSGHQRAGLTIIAFSGDMDKLLAAFMLANGAAAMGMPVTMFFTFWALVALKHKRVFKGKRAVAKFVTAMLPSGPRRLGPSKWSMLGLGRLCFDALLRRQHISNLQDLIALSREMHVRIVACETAMAVMAITKEELLEGIEFGGVATCLDEAQNAAATFFI